MMSEQQITERLESLGYKAGEVRAAMRDVANLILARTAAAYFLQLPESEQEKVKSLPEEAVEHYLAEHQESLPTMPQEEFEKIHDAAWEEYFASV